jgi:hypothetical protein
MADDPAQRDVSSIKLRHELPYFEAFPNDVDVWECGPQFGVLSKVDGFDLFFWFSAYILDGRTPGGYLAERQISLGSIVVMVPQEHRGRMNDNDYIVRGFNPYDYILFDDTDWLETDGSVVLQTSDVKIICTPPHWHLIGTQGDVSFDLQFNAVGPTDFFMGDFDKLLVDQQWASFSQLTKCQGHLTVRGQRHEIKDGFGCHERSISAFNEQMTIVDVFREPTTWIVGGNEQVQFQSTGLGPTGKAHVVVDGESFSFQDGEVTYEELETWLDPRSLVTIPCKWQVRMKSQEATFEFRAVAIGRSNRMWALRNGYVHDVWMLGCASGAFQFADGRSVAVEDMLFTWEWPHTICP